MTFAERLRAPSGRTLWRRTFAVGLSGVLGVCCFAAPCGRARAEGFAQAPPGARDLGRAGASVAGADSALGVLYNPATVLANQSAYDADAALHLNFVDTCFTRTEVVESQAGQTAGNTLPKVCSEGSPSLVPQLAISARFGTFQRWAVTLSLGAPAGVRKARYGDPVDSPARYLLERQELLQLFPGLGLAYQPHPRIRLGANFAWGITTFDFAQATFARILLPLNAGALSDASTRVEGVDAFTPRVQLGLWAEPIPKLPLELGLAFSWTQDVEVSNAKLHLQSLSTSYYPSNLLGPGGVLGNPPPPEITAQVSDVNVRVPMTSTLAVGLRYAHKLAAPRGTTGDRLANERFDVELALVTTFGRRFETIALDVPATTLDVPSPSPLVRDIRLALPERIRLPQRWQTAYALRLGGDLSVLPGRLAVRGGVSYETHGAQHGYEQLNFTPFSRVGLHAGVTWRIVRWVDLSVGYAHYFVPAINVSAEDARYRRITAGQTQAGDDAVVNAGKLEQRTNALAVQLSGRI